MKQSAFLLGVGVCLLLFGPLTVKAAEDDLHVLQLENARQKVALSSIDKQIEDLKTQIAGLRAENTRLTGQLKALGDQVKILTDNLAAANARPPAEKTTSPTAAPASPGLSPPTNTAPQSQPPKPPLPVLGDETSWTQVEANTRDYVGKTFIVTCSAEVFDAYNYGYTRARGTHVSLLLRELRADRTATGKHTIAYLRRDCSKPLVDALAKAVAEGYTCRFIRAKLTILPDRFEESGGAGFAELLDWQFVEDGDKKWGPWVRELESPPAKAPAARTPAVKR